MPDWNAPELIEAQLALGQRNGMSQRLLDAEIDTAVLRSRIAAFEIGEMGRAAALDGKGEDASPFPPETPQHKSWAEGWKVGHAIVEKFRAEREARIAELYEQIAGRDRAAIDREVRIAELVALVGC